jgi:hypothetical protein
MPSQNPVAVSRGASVVSAVTPARGGGSSLNRSGRVSLVMSAGLLAGAGEAAGAAASNATNNKIMGVRQHPALRD